VLAALFAVPVARAASDRGDLKSALAKQVPENIDELRAMQRQVKKVVDHVLPCVVNVRVGPGQGSGVIISADGYVLTAAHVSGPADRDVAIVLPGGRRVKGKTLGANRAIDSGLIKITDEGPWPFVPLGRSADLHAGLWCLAVGHPGGYKTGRPPVVRLGRILDAGKSLLQTDCPLVGGDSGGPLFDLQGRVIGIHSRIGTAITANIHVPVDTYRDTWDRLVSAEVWGGRLPGRTGNDPYLGVRGDPEATVCRIGEVVTGSPAERAGLRAGDVVTRFAGKRIGNFEDLVTRVGSNFPGDEVRVEILRGEETRVLRVVLGKKAD
jgi:serine protease Do